MGRGLGGEQSSKGLGKCREKGHIGWPTLSARGHLVSLGPGWSSPSCPWNVDSVISLDQRIHWISFEPPGVGEPAPSCCRQSWLIGVVVGLFLVFFIVTNKHNIKFTLLIVHF